MRSRKESTRSQHRVGRTSLKHWVAKFHHSTCIGTVCYPDQCYNVEVAGGPKSTPPIKHSLIRANTAVLEQEAFA